MVPPTRDRTHYLYLAVIAAVLLSVLLGLGAPRLTVEREPLGTAFVNLIKMMISPTIFCTIVLGFMAEARALTNFAGNAVATVLIGSWTREFDADQTRRTLSGVNPFNEATLRDEPEKAGVR